MILCVFEGAEREPKLFRTLGQLFFGEREVIVCSFGNNIYELYHQLKEFGGDGDIVAILRENKANGLPDDVMLSDFSEIYLFFDYDFQNVNLSLEEMNARLKEMLDMFCDETDNGKLYVSYPMVESLLYTKEIPDEHFVEYTVSRSECMGHSFKDLASSFSDYGSFDFIELPDSKHHRISGNEIEKVKANWICIIKQHTCKANFITSQNNSIPMNKEDVSQQRIFASQCSKYICDEERIAILNGFPLFIFDYFKELK